MTTRLVKWKPPQQAPDLIILPPETVERVVVRVLAALCSMSSKEEPKHE